MSQAASCSMGMEPEAAPVAEASPKIAIEDFLKVDLRVGKVLEAERVPKSDKLIKMKVDIGLEQRTIVGGIGKAYAPADLLNRLEVVVANLAPRKLMGIESHGMLLAASDNASKPYLVAPQDDAQPDSDCPGRRNRDVLPSQHHGDDERDETHGRLDGEVDVLGDDDE